MPTHTTLRCYYKILKRLNTGGIGKKDLLAYLETEDFKLSERTLDRRIEELRYDFDLSIPYNAKKNCYELNEEDVLGLSGIMKYFELGTTANMLAESLKEAKDTLDFIDFDDSRNLKGIENLKLLLDAIKNGNWIECEHVNYNNDTITPYKAMPYMLKEYKNRWYVIVEREDGERRTWGIDRLNDLKVLKKTFKRDKSFKPKESFKEIIGLDFDRGELEKIVLSMEPAQGRYLKSLPLHSSQEVIFEDEKETRIALYVRPNYELMQEIMWLMDSVKVLEPTHIVEEIQQKLKATLKQYL